MRPLLACFALLLSLATAAPLAAQATGTIAGRILSAGGGGPLDGARVSLGPGRPGAIADADGRFRIENLAPGRYHVEVAALGRTTLRRDVQVAAGETLELVLELAESPVPMPGVVVSANREEVRRAEVPANVGVIGGDEIRETRPHHPAEIAGRVPGVLVVDLGGEGHTVAMRQPITYNPVYAYLEDGIPIRSTGFFNHNALYEINIPGSERIEVFKGPATALYGSDAIGGVVNVLTRPASAVATGQVFAEGGAFGYARTLATASDTWGAHGVRGDLNLTHFDGWRDETGQDRQSGTLRHDWAPGEGQRLHTVLAASFIDSPGDGGSDVSRAELESGSTVNYTPIAFRAVEALRLSTTWKREAGAVRSDVTGYLRHNRLQLLPSWQLTYDPQVWDSQNHSIGLMAKVRRNLKPGNTSLVAGLDMDWSPGTRTVDEILPQQAANGAFVSYTTGARQYDYDVTFHGISPYLQASTTWNERLHLSGGLRYDHLGYRYDNHLGELQTGAHRRPASTDVSFDHVTPNVGASFETSRGNVFASYRHGFRVPSEDQLFVQGSALNTVALEPVRANSLEGGGRLNLGTARIEVSAYRMDIEDDILSFFNTVDFTSETSNAGRSRHWGIEAGGELGLGDLRLAAAYGYGRHQYLEWVTSTGSDYGGNEMESGPRHLVNAHVTWAPARPARASATVEWVRVGEYFTDPANQHRYGGHDLINFTASAPIGRSFDVLGRVNNLADVHYANTASFNPFVPPALQERFAPGTSRSYYLGAQYSWSSKP